MLGVDGQQGLQEAMVKITMDNMALQISPEEPYLDATWWKICEILGITGASSDECAWNCYRLAHYKWVPPKISGNRKNSGNRKTPSGDLNSPLRFGSRKFSANFQQTVPKSFFFFIPRFSS